MKRVLLTGTAGGLGRELACHLGRRGWSVHALVRKASSHTLNLGQVAAEEGWKIEFREQDAEAPMSPAVSEWIEALAPDLDAFVHLAAPRLSIIPVAMETPEAFERQWRVAVRFAMEILGRTLRPMSRRGGASLAFVLSETTLGTSGKGMGAYVSAKFGLLGLAKVIAAEHEGRLRVACFSPGLMDTDLLGDLSGSVRAMMIGGSGGRSTPVSDVATR
ncbi:MAG: SDR family NAD(P)-dependent oxidoreductase, partial [Verrucomicrobiia bacterium]